MNFRLCFFILMAFTSSAQTMEQCRQRFSAYLNFHGSLNGRVRFEKDALYLTNAAGKKDIAIYSQELSALSDYFKNSTLQQQQQLLQTKGLKKYNKKTLDSLLQTVQLLPTFDKNSNDLPLKGRRIALEAGHFSTSLKEAASEQKFLHFTITNSKGKTDTVLLFESQLTFNTVHILKNRLQEQGAVVFITRSKADHTSFDCTFTEWIKIHRKRTLDSLKASGTLSPQKHKHLLSCSNYDLFWDFFRDYDLSHRAAKINAFHPHLTLIVHYNVDEKNAPWKKQTEKNFTMAFIAGGFTTDNLNKSDARAHFVRLLITDQLNQSELLSSKTVNNFNQILNIPIAKANDADYLRDNCLKTASAGVFCRNLALCRKINSPLVYGESLYQDNVKESFELMKTDLSIYGIKANERLFNVAGAYYEAVMSFLNEGPLRH
jgi:hypothetical protein